jgi:hypothetical protein
MMETAIEDSTNVADNPQEDSSKDLDEVVKLINQHGAKVIDEYPLHPCQIEPIEVIDKNSSSTDRKIDSSTLLNILTHLVPAQSLDLKWYIERDLGCLLKYEI